MNRYDDYRGDFQRYEYVNSKYGNHGNQDDAQYSSKKISSLRPNERFHNHGSSYFSHSDVNSLSMREKNYTYTSQTLEFSDEYNSKKSKRLDDLPTTEWESDYLKTKKKKVTERAVTYNSHYEDKDSQNLERREQELRKLLQTNMPERKNNQSNKHANRFNFRIKGNRDSHNNNLSLELQEGRSTSQNFIQSTNHNVRPAHNYDPSFHDSLLTGQKEIKSLLITAKEYVVEATTNNSQSINNLRIQFLEEENKTLKFNLETEKAEKNKLADELKEKNSQLSAMLKLLSNESEKNRVLPHKSAFKTV